MEITNRSDLGVNLVAPQTDDAGREYWSYQLVRYTREGDLVLHWHKDQGPGIVGWSRVAGNAEPSMITWQSRGTYGRRRASSGEEPAWQAPLTGYCRLPQPIGQEVIRHLEAQVEKVQAKLVARFGGPIYFPFALSDRRPLRATQGYLVKFPQELVELTPGLHHLSSLAVQSDGENIDVSQIPQSQASAASTRMADIEVRRAIEQYAVELVMTELESRGYDDVENVGTTNSWDVTAHRGTEELHVEVKGSSTSRATVELTDNEVRHAEEWRDTLLVVVDEIRWTRQAGAIVTSGGRWREWPAWTPNRGALLPTQYRYLLPDRQEPPLAGPA